MGVARRHVTLRLFLRLRGRFCYALFHVKMNQCIITIGIALASVGALLLSLNQLIWVGTFAVTAVGTQVNIYTGMDPVWAVVLHH